MKPIGAPKSALEDVVATFKSWPLWGMMGWNDIKARYRGSAIGPFWITVGLGVTVGGVGVLYSSLLKVETGTLLPYLAVTLVIWIFIIGVLTEATALFQSAANIMQQIALPILIHLCRAVWRQFIIMGHNSIIFVIAAIYYKINVLPGLGLALVGAILVTANVTWMALVIGLVSARFKDVPQIVVNLLSFITIMTPVYWLPELVGRHVPLIKYNLFNYMLETVRSPLLGREIHIEAYVITLISAIIGWSIALLCFKSSRTRIIHWI